MAINGAQTFGNRGFSFGNRSNDNASRPADERQKAEFWLNIGYLANQVLDGEDEPRFISLPAGIPLDTTKHVEVRGSNEVFRAMLSAQNDLLDQILEEARKLAPGQAVIIGDPETQQLLLQLRRVNQQETVAPADNMFGNKSKLSLVA